MNPLKAIPAVLALLFFRLSQSYPLWMAVN